MKGEEQKVYQSIPIYWNYAGQYWNYYQPAWQQNVNYWNFRGGNLNPYMYSQPNMYSQPITSWNLTANTLDAGKLDAWVTEKRAQFKDASATNFRNIVSIQDYGANPFVIDIEDATEQNNTFRTALWTGKHLQLTLMSIPIGGEIGLEKHPETDQFLRIEEGQGLVQMGERQNELSFQREVREEDVILVPAGYWHNLRNTGNEPLKLYSIYAPPEHPFGTVHETKADADAAEVE